MFLKAAHVRQYKSVTDSGLVELDREVSCLVGKNAAAERQTVRLCSCSFRV